MDLERWRVRGVKCCGRRRAPGGCGAHVILDRAAREQARQRCNVPRVMRAKRLGIMLAGAAAATLAGCGTTTHTKAPAPARTVTISEAQANAEDACQVAEGASLKPSSAKCAQILRDTNLNAPTVIECGGGVSTDSSCVGARNLHRAFTNAAYGLYGPQKQTAAVEGDPVNLATTKNSWVCVIQKPGVRRCQSNVNSQVWVVFPSVG
jgi:hypothetical protein